jgi:hypothetical protein
MILGEFISSLEKAAEKYALDLQILAETHNSVKARLTINESISVQCYFNQKSATTNFVMIGWSRRLYGRDSVGGRWHRHPFEDPDSHDDSAAGSLPVEPEQFLDEVFEILIREELISPPVPGKDDQ